MDSVQRSRIIDQLNAVANEIKDSPEFFGDPELKESFLIITASTAAIMFGETAEFAGRCGDFVKDKSDDQVLLN